MSVLQPEQFLYHGTAMPIEGDRILPAAVHGKGSYWGETGTQRGEPSNQHAWAIPHEHQAWDFALDRAAHGMEGDDRARVYALSPSPHQTPGNGGVPGEFKAPSFDIHHAIDTMPGRQGTFPEVNWNEHALYHTEDNDANHPTDAQAQYGHRTVRFGEKAGVSRMVEDAREEGVQRRIERLAPGHHPYGKDTPLPGMSDQRAYMKRARGRAS